MEADIRRLDLGSEFETAERCWIVDASNDAKDDGLSIARARVAPGVTTEWHALRGVDERYLITAGMGRMEIEGRDPAQVGPGDIVLIPAGVGQRITNVGAGDLVFWCLCSPRFGFECYEARTDLEASPD